MWRIRGRYRNTMTPLQKWVVGTILSFIFLFPLTAFLFLLPEQVSIVDRYLGTPVALIFGALALVAYIGWFVSKIRDWFRRMAMKITAELDREESDAR